MITDHPALQECCNSKEQLLFLACLTLKTKTVILQNAENYMPNNTASQSCRLEYIPYEILAGREYLDPIFGTWQCAVWQARMSEGKQSPPSAWPTLIHTITPQQIATHAIPTILPVLFNACFILIMVPLCLLRSRNAVAWLYLFLHTVLRYFYNQYMSLVFFLHLLKLHFFIAKCIYCQCTISV